MTDVVSSLAAKAATAPTAQVDTLKQVAKQFEAVFLRQMIGSMRTASMGEGIFDSSATQQFRDMSDAKLADNMAGQGVLHVADLLVKQFGATLPGQSPAQPPAAASGGETK